MSVQSNQYLIYGAKLDYNEWGEQYEEIFEQYCDSAFDDKINPGGLHCLFDGMSGQYIIIGRCLKKSPEGGAIGNTTIEPVSEDVADMTKNLLKLATGIEAEMGLHLVTHYR